MMLKLFSNSLLPLSEITEGAGIRRLVDMQNCAPALRASDYLIVRTGDEKIHSGFAGYFFFERPMGDAPKNSYLLEPALTYLANGDIVRINPTKNALRILYRKNSFNNALLLTEQCDNFCLMCSQPPKALDDSYIVGDVLRMIPLMSPETPEITLTGGEPTLLGQNLTQIVHCLKNHLPSTAVHILSNGRAFKNWDFAKSISEVEHHDLMIGIPVYSDISSKHDYVVQADGAFDETIRGIINLKSVNLKVEIRVVLHQQTYERLPELARFIRRNLTFCDHVALMGLEMTGFTKFNLEKLWIDPKDYQSQLCEAVEILAQAKMNVSIYNHQLCVLDSSLAPFNRKSISDWKNEFMPECQNCSRKSDCGGFFSSSKLRYSAYIKPFLS